MRRKTVFAAVLAVLATFDSATPAEAGADLLPPRQACPSAQNAGTGDREQERALRCLVDEVRARADAGRVSANNALERAAGRKARDVARCGFTHTACDRPVDAWATHFDYGAGASWSFGENLARSTGPMTAREVVKGWLGSPPHRAIMLDGAFELVGAARRSSRQRTDWVLQLGCRGC